MPSESDDKPQRDELRTPTHGMANHLAKAPPSPLSPVANEPGHGTSGDVSRLAGARDLPTEGREFANLAAANPAPPIPAELIPPSIETGTDGEAKKIAAAHLRYSGHEVPLLAPGTTIAKQFRVARAASDRAVSILYHAQTTAPRHRGHVGIFVLHQIEGAARVRFLAEFNLMSELAAEPNAGVLMPTDRGETPDKAPFYILPDFLGSLRDRLSAPDQLSAPFILRAFPLPDRIATFVHLAELVGNLHAKGIVHRNLKPETVFTATRNRVALADFGLARLVGQEHLPLVGQAATGRIAHPTRIGDVWGTPAYMPPEQWSEFRNLDASADIFSLGAMLFELVALRPAFADTEAAEAFACAGEFPNLAHTLAANPSGEFVPDREVLAAIVAKATRRDKAERYATAHEMAADVREWKRTLDARAKRRQLVLALIAGGIGFAALSGLACAMGGF